MPIQLSVIVPCYREAPNVVPMVQRLDAALAGIAWEAVFVDDNSPDGTAATAKRLAETDPRVRCLLRLGRRGLASACIEGMLSSSAQYVAVIDGDLQHDEAILPRMLEAVRSGDADIAIGSRHVEGGAAGQGFSARRARMSDLATWLAALLLPNPVSDPMSGFFLLRRADFDRIAPNLSARGFKILLDVLLTAKQPLCAPLRVAEIPYTFRPRLAGESKLDVVVLLEYAALLVDKAFNGIIPWRFVAFAVVGLVGVALHMATLYLALLYGHLDFARAQWCGTLVAMLSNFHLNNRITYRDVSLKGEARIRGLLLFMGVCGIGALANVGIAEMLVRESVRYRVAGAAGAVITAVWNYAMSNTIVWRRGRR